MPIMEFPSSVDVPPTGADSGVDSEEMPPPFPIASQPDAGSGLGGAGAASDGGVSDRCDLTGEFESPNGESCYFVSVDTTGWIGARDACRAWGGELVSIDSPAENMFVSTRITSDIWIGANDRAAEGEFEWADGQAVTYFNWSDSQPDNFQGQENCVELRIIDRQWNDRPCGGDPQAYLCER